ncbi:Homoisocitrate dehydrogenase [Poriferisphaera corsica]|uniref:Homoisocitrate dehydrogenase n=1 Tax=Poriferisphaera corsica TaxID=2528020 RepID=A0A517YVE7_9BACT|nr:isocitrate/isopropylmalate dehydrogenase family protein [Poriferisphaera corsica]QDU34211.1 Homoisocitrate dehydrogenase [Poriferisphaera corsica]
MSSKYPVVLIAGDGIGPEVSDAVVEVLKAAGAPLEWISCDAGLAALGKGKDVMPEETLDAVKKHHVALKGPCTTPVGKGFTSVNVQLRKKLNLFAAIRPVRSLDGVPTRYEDVDLVIVRENTEGLYSGVENRITSNVVTTLKIATVEGTERIAKRAFEYVQKRGRKKLTVFHKANIMKMSDGLFLDSVAKLHKDFSDVPYDTQIIDAGCMKLVQDPTKFDVLLMENFYGDVVSDLAAGLVGGLGVVPGSNIGFEDAVFEAVHGSAPDIAGKGIANPLALLMSSVMMLNHMYEKYGDKQIHAAAESIKAAYNKALSDGEKTGDLGGSLGTQEFAKAVISRLS